jgi:hypothetical protein
MAALFPSLVNISNKPRQYRNTDYWADDTLRINSPPSYSNTHVIILSTETLTTGRMIPSGLIVRPVIVIHT